MKNKMNSAEKMNIFFNEFLSNFVSIANAEKHILIDQGHTAYENINKQQLKEMKDSAISNLKLEISEPIIDDLIEKDLKSYWDMYRNQQKNDHDVIEFALVVSALIGLHDELPFEDVKNFLDTYSSDMWQSQYTTNAIALFSEKGPDFFEYFNKGNGFKFQSPINGLDINLDEIKAKKTLS